MLAVLCASLLLVAMDATILNVALPSLIDDLRPTALQQLWIIDIYGLVLGGLLVTTGAVGDRFGRKKLFLIGFVLFGVASVIAATAGSSTQLIAGRVLLGIGGAMVMPSTLSLIRNIFTDPRERARAIGIWAAVAGAGAAIGPLIGGLLVEQYGWAAAFWVNVPVVVITVVAGIWLLPEFKDPGSHALDVVSALLSVVGVVALAWGIKHVAKGGPGAVDLLILAAGIGLLAWFALRQLKLKDPLLDVRLFLNRPFTAAALTTLMAMLAAGAALFLVSLWLQYVHGYTPFEAGLRTLPTALAMLVSSLLAPMLMHRIGVRASMALGLAALVAGFTLLALAPQPTSYAYVAVFLVTVGFGDGLAVTTAASVLVSAVPAERAGQAGAVSETSYELGVGLGVALLGSVHAAAFARHMSGTPAQAAESIGGAKEFAERLPAAEGTRLLERARDAFDSALTTTSYMSLGIAAAVLVLVVWMVPKEFEATGSGH
ncbi:MULTISPECIES: MFS transporter [unclassified Streptomyces]|uniref:MFS transporter n=1 Tax=unclassified Streptomyces TaxID=2593676 RepID=UPI001BEAEE99|nr:MULTISPECIES: MFS transporter [unclassified Streptomyces]MBT2402227.1 MFS transporter [Streptomyces sp. ISL-21]MBT2456255.1 MFS transporter [Streptomyces sp. ISL-86]MBT2609413.1 MFS transporter [Streptomyces sp. ISL-87]